MLPSEFGVSAIILESFPSGFSAPELGARYTLAFRREGHGYTLTTLDWSLRISRDPKHGRAFLKLFRMSAFLRFGLACINGPRYELRTGAPDRRHLRSSPATSCDIDGCVLGIPAEASPLSAAILLRSAALSF